jgi:hypothetical protein
MKPEVTAKLADARDFYALTKSILALCEPFGPVHSFRFVHNRGALRVACFIELEQPKQQALLARELGVGAVNETLCLEIPVRKDFGSPCRASSTPKPPLQPQEQHVAQLTH